MLFFAQLTLGVLVIVFGYDVMKSMALFSDVVRDAYSDDYYPSAVVVCGVYTSFVNLGGIQVHNSPWLTISGVTRKIFQVLQM